MIDLHVHSTISDGTLSPDELIPYAYAHGVTVMALTDHNTVGGIPIALEAVRKLNERLSSGDATASNSTMSVNTSSASTTGAGAMAAPPPPSAVSTKFTFIPGIEISAGYKDRDLHILGYGIDIHNKELLSTLEESQVMREQRNRQMCDRFLERGIPLDYDTISVFAGNALVLNRAHYAAWLVKNGYCSSKNDAFDRYVGYDSPCYIQSRTNITPEIAVKLILGAGGIPVFAHPLKYQLPVNEVSEIIDRLCACGLKGLEVYYAANISNEEDTVRHFALSHNLIMTGGSDFHGDNKPGLEIGTGFGNLKVPESVLLGLGILV